MEYCEKSTLRSVIDEGLYENQERIWRLLREIVEGLVHVHSQVGFCGRFVYGVKKYEWEKFKPLQCNELYSLY